MKINDIHVHSNGKETPENVEKALDLANIDRIALLSPYEYLLKRVWQPMSASQFRESVNFAHRLQKELEGRVYGLAFFDPRIAEDPAELVKLVEWALTDRELHGLKMIPAGWYPYDNKLHPIYMKLEELNKPILFHCGISWGFPDSSRFCRPVYWEYLMKFPRLRFALAHMCWPWIDEALATAGRFYYPIVRFEGQENFKPQLLLDTSSGAPMLWKPEALRKAIVYLGPRMLVYGSDCIGADRGECLREAFMRDYIIYTQILNRSADELEYIFYKNFDYFIKG